MQFFTILSLLAAAAIASPVANPDKTFTLSIPHITTKTIVIPETTFTISTGSYVETFTVPVLPTEFPIPSFPTEFPIPSFPTEFPKPSFPTGHPSFPIPSFSKPTAKPSHWRFAKDE